MRRIAILMVVTGLLLAGCGEAKRTDTLTTTLTAYQHAVRWDGMPAAEVFIDPELRAKHPVSPLDLKRYEQISVSSYDEGQGPIPVDSTHVRQVVQISVVNVHTQGERTIVDNQLWKFDPATNHWWLESGLPNITQN
jgi:hypothetical protein